MNPIEKFVARRQTPWKLFLQFVKVILVTTQLMIFGNFRYAHTNFYDDSHIAFEHLFFRDWDSVREVIAYPPATGAYAIYKKDSFYKVQCGVVRRLCRAAPKLFVDIFYTHMLTTHNFIFFL